MKIGMITDSLPGADFDSMSAIEGVEKSVELLRRVIVNRPRRAAATH